MSRPFRVVFLCVGNSCRSQMAEGFARGRYASVMEAISAGTHPAGIVQPETISCMQEKGIGLDGQYPKPIGAIKWNTVDLMINMSGAPVLSFIPHFKGGSLIWNIRDPIGKSPKIYREVRDQIEDLVHRLAETLERQVPPAERAPHRPTDL